MKRLALPLALYLTLSLSVFFFTIDDAYISLRYALNLANGHGLAFNAGEAPEEGFTNFSLVLIEAAAFKLGVGGIYIPKLVNLIAGAAFIIALVQAQRDRFGVTAALLFATATPVVIWTAGALETVLFAALVGGGLLVALRQRPALAYALMTGAALTRPEGLLFLVALVPYHGRTAWKSAASALTGVVIYHVWRVDYFGSLLPLTYLAKVPTENALETGVGGLTRFFHFITLDGNLLILAAVTAGMWSIRTRRGAWLIGGVGTAYLAYVVSRGYAVAMDDAYRLYVPLLAVFSVGIVYAADKFRRHVTASALVFVLAGLIAVRAQNLRLAAIDDFNWHTLYTPVSLVRISANLQAYSELGAWLRDNTSPNSVILIRDAGAIPYYSGLSILDSWSLLDETIIELKRRGDNEGIRRHIMGQPPDVIVQDQWGVLDDPAFRAQYEVVYTWAFGNIWQRIE